MTLILTQKSDQKACSVDALFLKSSWLNGRIIQMRRQNQLVHVHWSDLQSSVDCMICQNKSHLAPSPVFIVIANRFYHFIKLVPFHGGSLPLMNGHVSEGCRGPQPFSTLRTICICLYRKVHIKVHMQQGGWLRTPGCCAHSAHNHGRIAMEEDEEVHCVHTASKGL